MKQLVNNYFASRKFLAITIIAFLAYIVSEGNLGGFNDTRINKKNITVSEVNGSQLNSSKTTASRSILLSAKDLLLLNTKNPISKDVLRLWHDEPRREICLSLSDDATCQDPFFIGRLSGPSINFIKWKKSLDNDGSTPKTFCGSYGNDVIAEQIYFLEILTLFCEDFGVGSNASTMLSMPPERNKKWLEYNFTGICMQNPDSNRLTSVNSSIFVNSHYSGFKSNKGHWLKNNINKIVPLLTRYQPQECRNATQLRCALPMNDSGFLNYDFK